VKLIWLQDAIDDRNAIYDYIDRDSPDSAFLVDERIWNSISNLTRFPEMGRPGRRKGTRELVIQGTSYIAAYALRKGRIEILRIVHAKQRWPRKMPQL